MRYIKTVKGIFLERPNRFVAIVEIEGKKHRVHVKNTGRCRELLVEGATVYLEDFRDRMGSRKMEYSLVGVEKKRTDGSIIMINMDSQAPNKVVKEGLESKVICVPGLSGEVILIKGEKTYGQSRLDFYLETDAGEKVYMEVKGVTLEDDGVAYFPDAPTERGVKHIGELIRAAEEGYTACIVFLIQMKGAGEFRPNDAMHRAFGDALREAASRGVKILAYDALVTGDSLVADKRIKVVL